MNETAASLTVTAETILTGERAVHRTGTVQATRRKRRAPMLSGAYRDLPIVGRVAVLIPEHRDGLYPDWRIGDAGYRVQVDGILAAAILSHGRTAGNTLVLVADGYGLHPYAVQGATDGMAILAPCRSADLPGSFVVLSISGLHTGPAAS